MLKSKANWKALDVMGQQTIERDISIELSPIIEKLLLQDFGALIHLNEKLF